MKRAMALVLTLALLCSLSALPAFAAGNATISKDTTLSQKFNVYNDLTLAAGVTLTTKMAGNEPQGIEMHGRLTLESGAKLVGQGLLLMFPGSSYSGITLYYICQGEYRVFPDMVTAYEKYHSGDGYVFTFHYDSKAPGWTWVDVLSGGDPFFEPEPDIPQPQPQRPDDLMRQAEDDAETLRVLGLMKGAGKNPDGTVDYQLDRSLTRAEAVVMMIRLLGKEKEAKATTATHPFTDVPKWADKYIAYAYEQKLTNGVSKTKFGSNQDASAAMYLTFILRAMGYNDNAKAGPVDFNWKDAPFFARSIGIALNDEQISGFLRRDAAIASFFALQNDCRSGEPLFERLILQNVFTRTTYETVMAPYRR